MTTMTLPPMATGGIWLQTPDNRPPMYVTHEAHIARLTAEGARPIPDPRDPAKLAAAAQMSVQAVQATPSANELALQARIDQLEALLQQVLAGQAAQASADSKAHKGKA